MTPYIGTPTDYFIAAITVIIFFAIWNGLINKHMFQDKTDEQKRATSALWHVVGVIIRAILVFIAFIASDYTGGLIAIIVAYPVYDNVIDLIRGFKIGYYGESDFDQFAKKYKLDLVVTILCTIGIVLINIL